MRKVCRWCEAGDDNDELLKKGGKQKTKKDKKGKKNKKGKKKEKGRKNKRL